jgi:hypothetical protein
MPEYLVVTCGCSDPLQIGFEWDMEIVDTAASDASNMIVRGRIAIETPLPSLDLHLSDDSGSSHKIQVSIHGPKRDMGKPFSDHVVDFICGWVRGNLSKLLQYDRPLIGKTDFLQLAQGTPRKRPFR